MPVQTRYIFFASMDVDPAHEDLFNEVYDTEHVPYLLQVPGCRGVTRLKGEAFQMTLGGETKEMPVPSPVYTALYEIDSPDVLSSPEWIAAVEKGRWPELVRPHTKNRSHGMYKVTRHG
ncbi:MAG: hypothetical protein WBD34_09360 [Burkholderiaceae bacterium]